MKKVLIFLIAVFAFQSIKAQENVYCIKGDAALFSSVSSNGWVKFQPNLNLNATTLFQTKKASFGLPNNVEMRKSKTEADKLGFTHTWYKEFVNDIPVLYGHFILHEKDNQMQSGNGKIYTSSTINSNKKFLEKDAIYKALQLVNAQKYYWQDTAKENTLKRKTKNIAATYFPKPELMYTYDEVSKQIRLCYKISIQSIDAGKSGIFYLYADNGNSFLWEPYEHNTCDASTVNTVWYGNRTIFCYTDAFTSGWDLEDDCTPSTYKVYDYSYAFNPIFNSSNNTWTTPRRRSAATCLWSIRSTRDVFWNNYGRNGHDGSGGNIDMYFDYIFPGNSTYNASFSRDPLGDDNLNIGRGNEDPSILDDFGALDIMAHEFAHGVTSYTCGLIYQRESGALNESFSDIFAELVENKVFGGNNWLLGWDRIENGIHAPFRDMDNPLSFGDPDRYLGSMWLNASNSCTPIGPGNPGDNDYCGVHRNSNVQNRMFYILSVGGTGWTNDASSRNTTASGNNPYQWAVGGITIDKAARIAYRVLTVYLSANSNYFDSRNAWVHAAEDLYGVCSYEAIQTGKAWYAVGIGPPFGSNNFLACNTYGTSTAFTYSKSGPVFTTANCFTTVSTSGNQVVFKSGNKVVLGPGFSSLNGSKFRSFIDDCGFATY